MKLIISELNCNAAEELDELMLDLLSNGYIKRDFYRSNITGNVHYSVQYKAGTELTLTADDEYYYLNIRCKEYDLTYSISTKDCESIIIC